MIDIPAYKLGATHGAIKSHGHARVRQHMLIRCWGRLLAWCLETVAVFLMVMGVRPRRCLPHASFCVDEDAEIGNYFDFVEHRFSREISKKETVQERQLYGLLVQSGFVVDAFRIYSLEVGQVDLELVCCERDVVLHLSSWLQEPLCVDPSSGGQTLRIRSRKRYALDIGLVRVAKGGAWLSGDSVTMMDLPFGKMAIALSDGMGNGDGAQAESSAALALLSQLLFAGVEETLALQIVNKTFAARTRPDMYATVDLAIVDLYDGRATFIKNGSTPSFLIRGAEVRLIATHNLPVGILHDIDVELVQFSLREDDIMVMMTDGVYDAPQMSIARDRSLGQFLNTLRNLSPQQIANALVDEMIRCHQGCVLDDMTVVVGRIQSVR